MSGDPRPVIVGVDGSERAADALALADVLAPPLGAPVVIAFVHPYGRLSSLLGDGEYETLVRELATETLERARQHMPSVADRRMELVAADSASAGLHELAERLRAALIVIGSSHRSRLGRILPGGTGERLLSAAPAPVAVAPSGYAGRPASLEEIGCGFDGSADSQLGLSWAEGIARAAGARLRIVDVYEPVPELTPALEGGMPPAALNDVLLPQRRDQLDRAVAAAAPDLDVTGRMMEGGAADALVRESAELDLLVLGSRGYGPVQAVLLGSVSSAVVRSAESPVVVVPRGGAGD